jgi:hypothetical protein
VCLFGHIKLIDLLLLYTKTTKNASIKCLCQWLTGGGRADNDGWILNEVRDDGYKISLSATRTLAHKRYLSYFIGSMNVKQKVAVMVVAAFSIVGIGLAVVPTAAADCGTIKTSIIGGDVCKGMDNSKTGTTQTNGVWKLLIFALNILTAGVGILAVGGIVYGSILYTTASDKAEQTKKAISIITNVVIGIIAYGLMYLGLNFLIPGGIFT